MTDADYQYECDRAELLGLPKPSREEFFSRKPEVSNVIESVETEIPAEQIENAGVRREGFGRIGGGLDELNSILANTQKKLHRFKTVCGSFSNMLKLHVGKKKEDEMDATQDISSVSEQKSTEALEGGDTEKKTVSDSPRPQVREGKSDLDKLDSLINKAERAELSLSSQNKQMKKFLN